ncbi:Calcineurin-like phosphoesterase [Roseovarius lutimaris]|uniref:Calcineurin-like phosphoesterase n=1 Tax=Roseovarius lutimaris TaxID=1005928 RepID=A0A1I5EBP3_9RHOB|nr:metallophosphoesterase [Roseovarius lutimaris]SFO08686.1 Calcineurin-like phosphoesterase [Roseovarius lutimaris]
MNLPTMVKSAISACAMGLAGMPVGAADVPVPPARVNNPDITQIELLAAWTQITPDQLPGRVVGARVPGVELRYVVTLPSGDANAACATYQVAGAQSGTTVKARATLSGHTRDADGKSGFIRGDAYKVAVCQIALDQSAQTVKINRNGKVAELYQGTPGSTAKARAQLAGPAQLGARTDAGKTLSAVFMSDTGCRGKYETPKHKKFSRYWQDCLSKDPNTYPDHPGVIYGFGDLAGRVAGKRPDFIMHGGDHHYFYEDADYWFGAPNRFEYWLQEFLVPAQPMLLVSPFVFVRGNHERCDAQWSGEGWYELFGPGDQATCPTGGVGPWSAPWSFSIAPRNDQSVDEYTIYVIDSSQPGLAQANGAFGPTRQGQHYVANPSGAGRNKLWLTHYPPVKEEYYSGGTHDIGDRSIRHAVADALSKGCADTSCWPNAVLAGHQHLFQHLQIFEDQSDVLMDVVIAGHGGTRWDRSYMPGIDGGSGPYLKTLKCGTDYTGRTAILPSSSGKTIKADVTTVTQYGFVTLTRHKNSQKTPMGWKMGLEWYPQDSAPTEVLSANSCD